MEYTASRQFKPRARSVLMVVLWPAFMVSCLATGVFFSLFDPMEMIILDRHVEISMLGAYSIGFLCFWALGISSSYLTLILLNLKRTRHE